MKCQVCLYTYIDYSKTPHKATQGNDKFIKVGEKLWACPKCKTVRSE